MKVDGGAVAEAIFFSRDHLSAEDIAGRVAKGGAPPFGDIRSVPALSAGKPFSAREVVG